MRGWDRFFQKGFRPFFLGAGLWAALGMSLWTLIIRGDVNPDWQWSAKDWHVHEMVFGYVSAVIAGFLLTAVPNWTGIAAPKGARLAGLFGLWVAGRVAMVLTGSLSPLLVGLIDLSCSVLLEIWLIRTLLKSDNKRNLVVAGLLGLLILSNAAMHLNSGGQFGARGGILAVIMLISLIGGRVIPAFTRNWLAGQGVSKSVPEFGIVDKLALITSAVALGLFVADIEGPVTSAAFGLASIAGLARLARWQGRAVAAEPLVWIMHLGYLWLPVGYALLAISQISSLIPVTSALHALTSGAVGTITLAIMTRASLGHSDRPLRANGATLVVYLLVTLAALLRVGSGVFADPQIAYSLAGFVWSAAFVIFATVYGRMFLKSQSN